MILDNDTSMQNDNINADIDNVEVNQDTSSPTVTISISDADKDPELTPLGMWSIFSPSDNDTVFSLNNDYADWIPGPPNKKN